MKVPLAEQISALERCVYGWDAPPPADRDRVAAALSTLKWVERHQAELRVLGEFPGAEIRVLTPQATGLSAIGQGADEAKTVQCPKCGGCGWLFAHELDIEPDYGDPSRSPMSDDTKYQCDHESHAGQGADEGEK